MQSERTPLQSGGPAPSYVFMTNPNRVYRNKIRQFQCCVCAAILTVFVAAVVITVSYSVNHDPEDDTNTTTPMPPSEQLMSLMQQPWPLPERTSPTWNDPTISPGELEAAISAGQEGLRARDQLEESAPSLDLNSPSYKHSRAVGTSPRATELARSGFVMDLATRQIMAPRRKTPGGSVGKGPTLDADWLPQEVCSDSLDQFSSCPPTPYRSVDGSCNSPTHPMRWGVAMRPFRRTMPADYADGVSAPRTSSDGSPLPSAREVSVTVHRPLYKDDPDFTVMLAVWGQFIDHDITATALSQKSNGKTISCCQNGQWSDMKMHPECFPVRLGDGDPFYHQYNLTCMEFVRSAPAATCHLGAREQLNQASNFLDGSVVYGNTPELTSSLRRFVKGQLRMLVTEEGRTLLPISEDPNDGCNRAEMNNKGRYCFLTGDSRANENMHLTSMHLLWARQHNALATRLAALNPSWDDERVFQETRRIVGAQMQHITYNEFLPILFGDTMMDHLELAPKKTGYYGGYDSSVDPSIANNFAASAFRFAHTLLPGLMKVLANDTTSADYVEMHKILFNPFLLYQPGYLDGTLRGLMDTGVLKVDPHVSSELSQHLFEAPATVNSRAGPCGLDLVSLNIQRGRDHGLPSYPVWREHCGLSRPTSFSELNDYMDEDSVERISTMYKSVDDIDMYTGMLSEVPLNGGIIGPTLTCVLADQFVRTKKGDRFWYETPEQPQAFTPEQLDEVRKTTLAKVLCDTSDSVNSLQRYVMRSVTTMNPRVPCSELVEPDLSKWREVAGSYVQAGIARVKTSTNNVHIAPPTTVSRLAAPSVAWESGLKTYAVGATVMGGRISTAGGTAWSGELPLAIPVPLFDIMDTSGTMPANTVDPSTVGHGILWDGTLSTDSYGYANFEGRFSMPRYIHGKGIQQFDVKWLNGDFTFYTKLTWDSTRFIPIKVSGKYSSPVYLQERMQYQYLIDPKTAPATSSFYDVSTGFTSKPSIENGPGVYKSPCILHGAYSSDRKTFFWSGNITLIVPNAVPSDTWANYWSQTNEIGVYKRSPWLASSKDETPVPTPKSKTSIAVGVTVTSGKVTASSGGSGPVTWWDGKFPVALPVPVFNRVLKSTAGSSTVVFGTGVSWSGTSMPTGPASSDVSGSFSLPIYAHEPGANFPIQWWEGSFSLQMQYIWNATVNGAFSPGMTYTSPIYLRSPKSNDTVETVLNSLDDIDDHPTLQLLSAAGGGPGMIPKIPIILHGNYTPDETQFYWNGNVTLVFPNAPPSSPALTNQFMIKSQYKVGVTPGSTATKSASLGMTVEGGRISTTVGSAWSGEVPVAIPLPLFDSVAVSGSEDLMGVDPPVYGHGILWSGAISSDASGYANIEGKFSMPRFVHGSEATNFSVQWVSGEFVFFTRQIWNSTGYKPISLMGTYSSPVYLRASSQYEYLKDVMPASLFNRISDMNTGFSTNPAAASGSSALKAPLILHGTYSTDKTMFIWSGNVTLVVPNGISDSPPSVISYVKSTWMKSPAEAPGALSKLKSYKAVGVTVTSGSVSASSDGSPAAALWSGTFPATVPVPLFNRVMNAAPGSGTIVYGGGISWSGSLTGNGANRSELSGSFTLPVYTHGPGANFSIEQWAGKFSLQYSSLWNATLDGAVLPGVTYTTPVYFRQIKTSDSMDALIEDFVVAEEINDSPGADMVSAQSAIGGHKLPVVLHGSYSPDKTQFHWQGNATFLLPIMTPPPPVMPAQMIIKTSTGAVSADSSLVFGGTVVGGSIASPAGSIWSGELPVAIPLPLFDSVATAGAIDADTGMPPAYGHGILWGGTLSVDSSGIANVQGSYSLPMYIHGNGLANFSIKWLDGNFNFNSRLSWNSTLNMPTSLKGTYSSPIYLHARKEFDYLKYTAPSSSSSNAASTTFATAPAVMNDPSVVKAPLILLGTYSVDRTMFIWSGNYSLIIPNAVHAPTMQLLKSVGGISSKSKSSMAVGVSVTSGSVTASTEGSIPVTWWNGKFPAAIPVPLFNRVLTAAAESGTIVFGSGVSWSGSATTNELSGSFSVPIYSHGTGSNLSIAWWSGTFSLQYNNLWNSTLDGILTPGVTYNSPIYFREAKMADSIHTMMKDYTAVEKLNDSPMQTAGSGTGGPKIPIILHGSFTPDKTQFYWSGNITFITPLMAGSPPVMAGRAWVTSSLKAIPPGNPIMKPLVLGATVMGGYVSTTGGSAWSGELPVAIPVPMFDSVYTPGEADTESTDPPVYGHGILWDGTVSMDSSGSANIEGSFSMPKYIHGNGLANFTIKWLSGSFVFYTKLAWNSNMYPYAPISVSGTYSSPVYLKEGSEYEYLTDPAYASVLNSFSDVSSGFVSQPSVANGPGVFRSPCILHGIYSTDRKTFLWSGNVTLIVPNAIPVNLWPGSLYSSNLEGKSILKTSSGLQNVAVAPAKGTPVGLSVVSGTVTASSDDTGPKTWWDGSLPAALPVPLFNRVLTAAGPSGSVVFGTGVSWNGQVSTTMAGSAMMKGTFSLPVYSRAPGAMFSIQWWNGDFSFQVNTLWNKTLDGLLTPGITYSSPVYLRAGMMGHSVTSDVSEMKIVTTNPTVHFVTSVQGAVGSQPKAPIILYGSYSPDKSQFWWSGNATLVVPSTSPNMVAIVRQQKKMASAATKPKAVTSGMVTVGAVVTSGSIVAGSDSSGPSMWWNGELPAEIQFNTPDSATNMIDDPPSFAHGVSWQGTLTKTAMNEVLLQGTFSMPRYTNGAGLNNFTIEWYEGQFSFQMSLLWNSTVDGLVSPGQPYSSSVYLHSMAVQSEPSYLQWDQPAHVEDSDNLLNFIAKSKEIITGSTQVPVILQGTYSPDRSVFSWSGNVIISFPAPSNTQLPLASYPKAPMLQPLKDTKPSKPSKPIKPKTSQTLGVTVLSGSIEAGLDGVNPTLWWDGQIPLTFPLPAKDAMTTVATAPALSQDITWSGNLMSGPEGSAVWEGQFSLPSFNKSNGTYVYTTPMWMGKFSFTMNPLWQATVEGMVKPGVTYSTHIRLVNTVPKKKSTLLTDINDNDVQPDPPVMPSTEPPVIPTTEAPAPASNNKVSIMLQGYLSPDKTSFMWTGRAILQFPL